MQDAVTTRLEGPTSLKGYYYDDSCNRYFAVPKPGTLGWTQYKDTCDRYLKEIQATIAPTERESARFCRRNSLASVADALLEIRTGNMTSTRPYTLRVLEKAFISGSSALSLPLDEQNVSKVLQSPLSDTVIVVSSRTSIKNLDICADAPLTMAQYNIQEPLSGLEVNPRSSVLSCSHFSGTVCFLDPVTLDPLRAANQPFFSGIWCHKWLSDCEIVFGGDRSAFMLNLDTMRKRTVYSEKSSVFSLVASHGSTSTFYCGTRAGKVLRADSRSSSLKTSQTHISANAPINSLAISSDDNYLFSCSTDGKVQCTDLRTLRPLFLWSSVAGCTNTARLCLDDSETRIALLGSDNKLRLFDSADWTEQPASELAVPSNSMDIVWSKNWGKRRYSGFGVFGDSLHVVTMPHTSALRPFVAHGSAASSSSPTLNLPLT